MTPAGQHLHGFLRTTADDLREYAAVAGYVSDAQTVGVALDSVVALAVARQASGLQIDASEVLSLIDQRLGIRQP